MQITTNKYQIVIVPNSQFSLAKLKCKSPERSYQLKHQYSQVFKKAKPLNLIGYRKNSIEKDGGDLKMGFERVVRY